MNTIRNLRRGGLAAALSLSLLAVACGDDPSPVATSSGVSEPEVVHIAGAGSGDGRVAATESAATADMSMIAPWYVAEYVVGAELPALPGEANGWRFAAGSAVDADVVRGIADALGVDGDLVDVPADFGGGWRVGPDDGSAPALYVSADGQLSWWYSPAYQDGRAATGVACVEAVVLDPPPQVEVEATASEDGTLTDVPATCVDEFEPPVGVPSAGEARSRAEEILRALGVDPAGLTFETYADEWSASVSAYLSFGGVRSTVGFSFGFGAEGRLEWASGVMATPVEVGPYPLVSVDDALARLRDGFYGWAQPAVLADSGDVAVDSASPALGAPEIEPAACAADGTDCLLVEPQPVTVTIVDVRLDLWMLWDIDGTVWLLPAYAFVADDGSVHTVPAVADEFLVVDDAPSVEPGGGETGVAEPGGVVGEPPVDPQPIPDPGLVGEEVSPEAAESLLGLAETDAVRQATANGWTVRIVARDGESFPVTEDYSPTRVNLTVASGEVTAVSVG